MPCLTGLIYLPSWTEGGDQSAILASVRTPNNRDCQKLPLSKCVSHTYTKYTNKRFRQFSCSQSKHPPSSLLLYNYWGGGGGGRGPIVVTLLLSPLEILKICLNLPDKIDHGRTGQIFRLPKAVKKLVFYWSPGSVATRCWSVY